MQITSIEKHAGSDIWHGVATEDADHYQWFWDEDSPLPLKMRQQDQRNPRCWMNVDPPAGARQIVLRAIREARS
jgi:hypothetical protein